MADQKNTTDDQPDVIWRPQFASANTEQAEVVWKPDFGSIGGAGGAHGGASGSAGANTGTSTTKPSDPSTPGAGSPAGSGTVTGGTMQPAGPTNSGGPAGGAAGSGGGAAKPDASGGAGNAGAGTEAGSGTVPGTGGSSETGGGGSNGTGAGVGSSAGSATGGDSGTGSSGMPKPPSGETNAAEDAGVTAPGLVNSSVAGGPGGTSFSDASYVKDPTKSYITAIRINYASGVDRIQVMYDGKTWATAHGGGAGVARLKEDVLYLQRGEVITKIEGRSGTKLDQITLYTNFGRSSNACGGNGGTAFTWSGTKLVCFSGKSGDQIDSLQAHWLA